MRLSYRGATARSGADAVLRHQLGERQMRNELGGPIVTLRRVDLFFTAGALLIIVVGLLA